MYIKNSSGRGFSNCWTLSVTSQSGSFVKFNALGFPEKPFDFIKKISEDLGIHMDRFIQGPEVVEPFIQWLHGMSCNLIHQGCINDPLRKEYRGCFCGNSVFRAEDPISETQLHSFIAVHPGFLFHHLRQYASTSIPTVSVQTIRFLSITITLSTSTDRWAESR